MPIYDNNGKEGPTVEIELSYKEGKHEAERRYHNIHSFLKFFVLKYTVSKQGRPSPVWYCPRTCLGSTWLQLRVESATSGTRSILVSSQVDDSPKPYSCGF